MTASIRAVERPARRARITDDGCLQEKAGALGPDDDVLTGDAVPWEADGREEVSEHAGVALDGASTPASAPSWRGRQRARSHDAAFDECRARLFQGAPS